MNSEEKIAPVKKALDIGIFSTTASLAMHLLAFFLLLLAIRLGEAYFSAGAGGGSQVKGGRGGQGIYYEGSGSLTEVKPIEENSPEKLPELQKPDVKGGVSAAAPDAEKVYVTGKDKTAENSKSNASVRTGQSSNQSIDNQGSYGQGTGGYGVMGAGGFDSTGLGQVYSERTLNVRVRYPNGWVYMDQHSRKKLDGVTFWSSAPGYNPPPYIHLEVVDKYMFNPARYKRKYEFSGFTAYYNDPEEMEGQVSQTMYLRTNDDEDYIIKLIMQGREQFRSFQPVFFSIVSTFRFGNSMF